MDSSINAPEKKLGDGAAFPRASASARSDFRVAGALAIP